MPNNFISPRPNGHADPGRFLPNMANRFRSGVSLRAIKTAQAADAANDTVEWLLNRIAGATNGLRIIDGAKEDAA